MSEERYYCVKCKRSHSLNHKIGKDHLEYRKVEEPYEEPQPEKIVEIAEGSPEPIAKGIGEIRFGGPATGSPPTPPNRGVIPILQKEEDTFKILSERPGSPDLCGYIYWARDSCVECQGHRCAAASDKKLAPALVEELCRNLGHHECVYYMQALETGLAQICPYQGPPPAEKAASCSGSWCHADDKNIRVPKTCKKFWVNCDVFARKKWAGKPFYRNLPIEGTEVDLLEKTNETLGIGDAIEEEVE